MSSIFSLVKRDGHMNVQVLHFINKSLKPLKKKKSSFGTFTEFYQGTVSIIIYFFVYDDLQLQNSHSWWGVPVHILLFG